MSRSTDRKRVIKPGEPVRHSQSGQPIMAAMDLLGRRWTLRILWSLRKGERKTSRSIQSECGISSPNVVVTRLRELRDSGIVSLEKGGGYALTILGSDLLQALAPLAEWADHWADQSGRPDLACYGRSQRD